MPIATALPTLAHAQELPMATPNALGPALPPELTTSSTAWPTAQGSLDAHRAAIGSDIATGTIDRLGVAWRFPITAIGGYGAVTATPLVLGDSVYLQDMECNVFALDRQTGSVRWQHLENTLTAGANGVAIGYGLVFASVGLRAEAIALDAATGEVRWRVRLSANPNEFIFMQPLVYDNVVYVATSPAAYIGGTRGFFFALDAASGAVLWQWDTTTDNLWGQARVNAGGGVWYPPSIDEQGNLYFGTGNPAPWPEFGLTAEEGTRPGPNLYTSSMVSLDLTTGAMRWFIQAKPHDQFDHDFQLTPILASATIDGKATPLAIGSGKTGTVIAAHAETGEEVWRASVGEHNAYGDGAVLPLPSATPVTILPGPFGGVLTPLAYADDTVFVPVVNLPLTYSTTSGDLDLAGGAGEMVALSVVDGSLRWRTPVDTFFCAGATVANDVVFGGGLDGVVRGFRTSTGEEIWRYQTGAGINAPLAIAGDLLLVAAGGPFFPTGTAAPPPPRNELIALRLDAVSSLAATPVP